jgi:NadR type nicotinamide-nucleotide adenylyltransferase
MPNPKRILILGPESTGKSTLAEDLASYFEEPWVPEFAREYLEKIDRPYIYEDLLEIGKGQVALEDRLADEAKRFLFVDTDLRVIKVWSEYRFGKSDPWVDNGIAERYYDLILLTDTDLPWAPDPLREYPELEMRRYFFDIYLQLAVQSGFPYEVISRDRSFRTARAIELVNSLA